MKRIYLSVTRALLFITLFSFGLNISYAADDCPQKRRTRTAPPDYLNMKNPLPFNSENLEAGRALYLKNAKPAPCYRCHGKDGNADSRMAKFLRPRPRIFTCKKTMDEVLDGQVFWVIRKGSKGSGMSGYPRLLLSDEEVWKILIFIRSLSK